MQLRGNGIEIHYQLAGPESADVVTLSHALMADLRMWDPHISSLSDYRVLRYDIRGHGNSEATDGEYDLGLLADDVQSLLDELKIESTHFVGSSIGGMIGLELATRSPDRLASLTLCDTRGHCTPTRADSRQQRVQTAAAEGMESLVDSTLKDWFTDAFRRDSDTASLFAEMIRQTSVVGMIGCTRAIESQNHSSTLGEIKLPCLITVGEEDPWTPLNEAFDLHVGIDGSDMVVLPKMRHLASVEAGDQFNDVLVTFLKQYS